MKQLYLTFSNFYYTHNLDKYNLNGIRIISEICLCGIDQETGYTTGLLEKIQKI